MKLLKSFLEVIEQAFMIYGFCIIFLLIFCVLFGEDAQTMSTIFSLGSQGVAVETLTQYFLLAMIISLLKTILFTDGIIKGMSGMVRVILMFSGVIISIVIFIIAFGWFQIDDELAWLLFFVNFFICTIVSVSISSIRNRIENRKLDEALQRLKRGEENE